jgi:hypothetical protein
VALRRSPNTPTAPPDHEANRQYDDFMASTGIEGYENPGRAALGRGTPEDWEQLWTEWLFFLVRASQAGGFVVR